MFTPETFDHVLDRLIEAEKEKAVFKASAEEAIRQRDQVGEVNLQLAASLDVAQTEASRRRAELESVMEDRIKIGQDLTNLRAEHSKMNEVGLLVLNALRDLRKCVYAVQHTSSMSASKIDIEPSLAAIQAGEAEFEDDIPF